MTPRRDVEEEIYAQLYGERSEPEDAGSTRVIDGDHRTHPVREDPEPEPPQPRALDRALEAIDLAAAAGARSVKEALSSARAQGVRDAVRSTRAQGLRDAVHSARAQSLRDAVHSARARVADGLSGRERRLGLGAFAVGLIVLIAGLSSGLGGEPQRGAGPPPGPTANQLAAESAARAARDAREAREARETRRRKVRRRRAAAQRRREERATASYEQTPADDTYASTQAPSADVCPEDVGCVPQSSPVRQPTNDDEGTEQSDRETVGRPRVRTTFRYGKTSRGDRYVRDVDVDVSELD